MNIGNVLGNHTAWLRGVWPSIALLRPREEVTQKSFCRSPKLLARDDCVAADPANTLTDRLNTLLNSSGPGYVLDLCPSTQYLIQAPLLFAAPDQEIRTLGEPFGDERAMLVVNGPVFNGSGHTTAVDGTCANCNGVRLRHVQVRQKSVRVQLTGLIDRPYAVD